MSVRVQDLWFLDRNEAVAVPAYETEEHSFFGFWSTAILNKTRMFLIGILSFSTAMTIPIRKYTLRSEPVLKDTCLRVGDIVRWDRVNIPADLRIELGSGTMRVIEVTMVSDDIIAVIGSDGRREVPEVPYSPMPVAQVVAIRDDGKMFIAPNYYFERV